MDVIELCRRAKAAKYEIQRLSTGQKDKALRAIAASLIERSSKILAANAQDVAAAQERGMAASLVDRLRLDEKRIAAMAEGLRQVADLQDPLLETMERIRRPNGLVIEKVRVPLGVIGIIYESRPNVTADAFALCFKSGNAVVLKGGSDAIRSNASIASILREGLKAQGVTADAVSLIESTDREATRLFMQQREYVDVLIPRGSAGLIRSVVENSKIPVIETGAGNCHIYIDESADVEQAIDIVINAKTQRLGVCNACESLVIHEGALQRVFPPLVRALREKGVTIRADEAARASCGASGTAAEGAAAAAMPADGGKDPGEDVPAGSLVMDLEAATAEDYATEYLDLLISVKTVSSIDEAISHINRYSTHHSEAIITADAARAERFLAEVDSACVYVNASTRFTDGFEFGFGAEIGISTQMLHARGPMGLRELTSYKYKIHGSGQVRP